MSDNQYGPGYPVVAYAPMPKPVIPGRSQSIAGMTLGITAWGLAVLSFFMLSFVSAILSLIGLPLSIVGFNRANAVGAPKGMAITGIVLNVIGVALLGLTILFTLGSLALGSA